MIADSAEEMAEVPSEVGRTGLVRLSSSHRLRLAARIALDAVRISMGLRQARLPDLVDWVMRQGTSGAPVEPRRLAHLVHRVMNLGPFRPRCLTMSLVLLRSLRRQGTAAELVFGLPPGGTPRIADCWVEVEGMEIEPPGGRLGHR